MRKQHGIVVCAIAQSVIIRTGADLSESLRGIESAGPFVVARHLQEYASGALGVGEADKFCQEQRCDAAPLRGGIGGEGKDFALIGNDLRNNSSLIAGQEMDLGILQGPGNLLRWPWTHFHIGAVHDPGEVLGCHGRIAGAVSRDGAASAALM